MISGFTEKLHFIKETINSDLEVLSDNVELQQNQDYQAEVIEVKEDLKVILADISEYLKSNEEIEGQRVLV